MRDRTPEQIAKFEAEQARIKAYQEQVVALLIPLFAKYDPESLISLTPEGFHEDACRHHYDCVIKDAAEAIQREGGKKLTEDGLAHILSLANHIHYDAWHLPIRTFSVHYKMAEELQPLLPEWRQLVNPVNL